MIVQDGRTTKRFFLTKKNWINVGVDNRKFLEDFEQEKAAIGMSEGARYMYLFCLVKLAKHFKGKNFKEMTKKDLIEFFEKWKDYKSPSLKVSVKAFFKWLNQGVYPETVTWIKGRGFEKKKLPEDILTPEEVKQLADSSLNPRDRALILLLYESGARAGELIGLNLKDVKFDEYGAVLMLNGKTGMRRVRVIDCVPDIKTWLNNHPRAKDPNSPLFLELRGKFNHLGNHATLANIIKAAKRRAGLNKRIYPHLFRHSRATHLAKEFTEQELKVIFGWTGGSRMPATYVHLSGFDIDKKMLEKRGLLQTDQKNGSVELKPVVCRNCNCENSSTARFCTQCGIAFHIKDAMDAEMKTRDAAKLMEQVFNDEELRIAIARKMMNGQTYSNKR